MTSREEFDVWDDSGGLVYEYWEFFDKLSRTDQFFECWQAARATAPAWHDVPTVPGLWVSSSNDASFRLDAYDVEQIDRFNPRWRRWFGPIPQDAK